MPNRRCHSLWLAGAAVAVLIAAAAAAACSPPSPDVDFSKSEAGDSSLAPVRTPATIRIAIAPVLSALPTSELYDELARYLSAKLGRPVELVLGKTYAEINDLLRSGEVAVAFVCTNPYVDGQEDFGLELLVVPQVEGKTVYYSTLIVGASVEANSLADLRGATFAFSDPLSNSGRLVPLYQLARIGESPETFFSRTIFTYSHDSSIRAVAEGIVDAAAVDSLVLDYMRATAPAITERVRVIETWGPFGINPVVVHPRIDPALKAGLRDVLIGMADDPEGARILARLRIDRFVPGDDRAYDSVRAMRAFLGTGAAEP